MLRTSSSGLKLTQAGVTLIELIVVMVLVGVFIAMSAPIFTAWMQDARIRTTASTISAGLQLAKAEAVSRNTLVRFQLTTTLDAGCALSVNGSNWVINMVAAANAGANSVEGSCDSAPSTTAPPQILHTRSAQDGGGSSQVAASDSAIIFNGLGRQSAQGAAAPALTTFDISNPSAGQCAADSGSVTCLRVIVTAAGQVRMCNPVLAATDPQGC